MKIGRILGIDVYLHWTLILAIAYLLYDLKFSRGLQWDQVLIVFGFVFLIFISVLLHEYGHALMARYFGVLTHDIIMTPIGGLARLERMPQSPFQELMITIAGPAVNFVLGCLAAIYLLATGGDFWLDNTQLPNWSLLATVIFNLNFILFVFNLIPAFPMDGGRILRSGLAFFMSHSRATWLASFFGQICAVGFIGYGFVVKEYNLCIIGAFVFFAAQSEIKMQRRFKS
ncbi:MAG: site-2 protease family protein, partial [Planctomycetota bacterium]